MEKDVTSTPGLTAPPKPKLMSMPATVTSFKRRPASLQLQREAVR